MKHQKAPRVSILTLAIALITLCLGLTLTACNETQPKRRAPEQRRIENLPQSQPAPTTQNQDQAEQAGQSDAADGLQDYLPPSEDSSDVIMVEIREDSEDGEIREYDDSLTKTTTTEDENTSGGAQQPNVAGRKGSGDADTTSGAQEFRYEGNEMGPIIGANIDIKTNAEEVAGLDKTLDEKLAAFDEIMRRARKAAEEEGMEIDDPIAVSAGHRSGHEEGRGARLDALPEHGAGGRAETVTGQGNTGDLSGEVVAGNRAALLVTPVDIPDGADDDIVARQLREAATKEADPVLKRKLWDEYKKYASGL